MAAPGAPNARRALVAAFAERGVRLDVKALRLLEGYVAGAGGGAVDTLLQAYQPGARGGSWVAGRRRRRQPRPLQPRPLVGEGAFGVRRRQVSHREFDRAAFDGAFDAVARIRQAPAVGGLDDRHRGRVRKLVGPRGGRGDKGGLGESS